MTGQFRTVETWRGVLAFATVAVFLQALVGGIRPVDGSMLAHFARSGFDAQLPTNFAQYLLDSPLKVALVHALFLTSPLKLAAFFAALTFLPFAAVLLAKDEEVRKTSVVLLAALPLTRVSLSSLGVGDAVLVAVAVALVVSPSRLVAIAGALVAIGWHVQQGALIVIALGLVMFFRGNPRDRAKLPFLAAGLLGGLLIEFALQVLFIPQHQGRAGSLALYLDRFLLRSLFYWPAAVVVAIPGLLSLWLSGRLVKLPAIVPVLLVLAFAISTTTADVSRVFFILSFPVIFLLHFSPPPVLPASSYSTMRQTNLLVPVLAVSVVVPLLGWSGVEIFDWRGLAWRIGLEWGWSEPIDLFLDLHRAFATPPT
jgi:hypothetical protein